MMAETEMGLMCGQPRTARHWWPTADANREAGNRLSLTALGRNQAFRTLVLDFWSLEPGDSTFLLVKPPWFVALSPNSPRKLQSDLRLMADGKTEHPLH